MKDEDFKNLLTTVADWRIPDTITDSTSGNRRKSRSDKKEIELETDCDICQGPNLTFPPQITKLHKQSTTCEDCGLFCPNGREKEAKLHKKNGKVMWRQKCHTCEKWQNPYTGKFELTGSNASIKFNDFMRETKNAYKTKGNLKREEVKIKSNQTIIESDTGIITIYHRKNN